MTRKTPVCRGRSAAIALGLLLVVPVDGLPQGERERRTQVTITAGEHGYEPARLEIRRDEIVAVTLVAKDGPHSFNVDAYRIAKRAEPGRPVHFEFRAEHEGRFPYYCNLTGSSGRPHEMRGELVVR
jgi:heme/copper-type cytochrome/quinol oxidase subunit 2